MNRFSKFCTFASFKTLTTLALVGGGLVSILPASAETRRQIPCPSVIADKENATLFSSRARRDRFACFKSTRDARKDGFVTLRAARARNFSGWYRMGLQLVNDTCVPAQSAGPVLFLQVHQTETAVFAQFCPSFGEFSGINSPNGFTISAIDNINPLPSETMCEGGPMRDHKYLEFTQVLDGAPAFSVKYTLVRRCLNETAGPESCTRTYTGTAFHETHPIWPPAAASISGLPAGCAMALSSCADCHPELAELLP